MSIPEDKKLTVIFRIESGCLGPQGLSHIDTFCEEALKAFKQLHPTFMSWVITPRHDKSLPELGYSIGNRPLAREHAAKYLQHFDIGIDSFESDVFNQLPEMIDLYFGR